MRKQLGLLALSFILISVTGCSLFRSQRPASTDQATDNLKETALIEAHAAPEAPKQGIEVTWEIPSEPVDGFIIRYGNAPTALSKEVTISAANLREEKDSEYGPVYRYLIRDVENAERLFISIAAVKGQSISNFSQALEAQPETTAPSLGTQAGR